MVDINTVLNLQLTLFALGAIGLFARKIGFITEKSRGSITDLFINIILPANIIVSFQIDMTKEIFVSSATMLAIAFAAQFLYLLLSKVLYTRIEDEKRVVLEYATICSNAAFIGLPVVGGIYGAEGMLYASIAIIPLRIFMWSAGLSLFTKTEKRTMVLNLLKHPCVNAVWVGFALMLIPWKLPVFIDKTIVSLSNCTTAISMIVIGSILAEIDFRTVFNKLILYYSTLRLVLIPVLVLILLKLFHIPELLSGVTVLLAGMPAGSTTAILASKYNGDAEFASKCVFATTLLSVITIPLLGLLV